MHSGATSWFTYSFLHGPYAPCGMDQGKWEFYNPCQMFAAWEGRTVSVGSNPAENLAPFAPLHFAGFALHARERRLQQHGRDIPLGGKAFDLLACLTVRAGDVVTKSDLCEMVWPGMVVEEATLRFHIATLRKALARGKDDRPLIKTIARRGYSFTGQVQRAGPTCHPLAAPVGMEQAIADLRRQLTRRRFITLVGPVGVGKSRLARHLAAIWRENGRQSVVQLDVSRIEREETLTAAVKARLAAFTGSRVLLILDGCEHMAQRTAHCAETLLDSWPGLTLLATSRQSLRARREHVYRLRPLACPAPGEAQTMQAVMAFPAARLFVERMQAGRLDEPLADRDAPLIARICSKLDGLPLALELVAGRAATCGIAQTAKLIDRHLGLLWQGRRTAPPRHRTLQAAFDWSYDRLLPEEQMLLDKLARLDAPFTLERMVEATGLAGQDQGEMVATLGELVAKSLVQIEEQEAGHDKLVRYRLLETTRVYVLNKSRNPRLASSGVQNSKRLHMTAQRC
jgi:predicted ATPase/DNA-binding winged helix-turn-helix (wHTH) protein